MGNSGVSPGTAQPGSEDGNFPTSCHRGATSANPAPNSKDLLKDLPQGFWADILLCFEKKSKSYMFLRLSYFQTIGSNCPRTTSSKDRLKDLGPGSEEITLLANVPRTIRPRGLTPPPLPNSGGTWRFQTNYSENAFFPSNLSHFPQR